MAENPDQSPASTTLIDQARQLLRDGRGDEAARTVRRYLSTAPGGAQDYELLGVALGMAGEGLQALAALEQAHALDPQSASIAYNLGQVYRQAGRGAAAITAFERAIALRPDYDAAKRALAAVQQPAPAAAPAAPAAAAPAAPAAAAPAAPAAAADDATIDFPFPPAAAGAPPAGKVLCPHCGMDSRPGAACEWCSRAMAPPVSVSDPGAAAVAEVALARSDHEYVAEGNLFQRLLKAMWMLIASPVDAVNGGIDYFYNSSGAVFAVVGAYLAALGIEAALTYFQVSRADTAGELPLAALVLSEVGTALLWVVFAALIVATYNAVTGGSDSFLGDFGSLALSFALIYATITFVTLPLTAPMAMMHVDVSVRLLVYWGVSFWIWVLQVLLIMAATDITFFAAAVLLWGINIFSRLGLHWVVVQLFGSAR
jgi:tetratricopeptide (TPR) repeat protein